eukprot:Lankesteria_metandrocarpae@DN5103_c0_g1_i4.p1
MVVSIDFITASTITVVSNYKHATSVELIIKTLLIMLLQLLLWSQSITTIIHLSIHMHTRVVHTSVTSTVQHVHAAQCNYAAAIHTRTAMSTVHKSIHMLHNVNCACTAQHIRVLHSTYMYCTMSTVQQH